MTDLELFKKRYLDGATYKEMKKEFELSFSTINAYRVRLNLPKREKSFTRFEFSEERFLQLYNSKNPFYTYADISKALGCCESLIFLIKRRLGLSDREVPSKLIINEDKFRQMYLSTDYTLDDICDEFSICISTLQKLRDKLFCRQEKISRYIMNLISLRHIILDYQIVHWAPCFVWKDVPLKSE
jgi:hypothetical protein